MAACQHQVRVDAIAGDWRLDSVELFGRLAIFELRISRHGLIHHKRYPMNKFY